jgi:hypothetical protein
VAFRPLNKGEERKGASAPGSLPAYANGPGLKPFEIVPLIQGPEGPCSLRSLTLKHQGARFAHLMTRTRAKPRLVYPS